jgi:hypothetical protein
MAKLYKIVELERLHRTRRAVNGRVYEDINRVKYTGTPEGFIERQVNVAGDVEGNTLGSSVNTVGGVSSTELISRLEKVENTLPEKVDETDFEKYKQEAKCFSIAMAVAL